MPIFALSHDVGLLLIWVQGLKPDEKSPSGMRFGAEDDVVAAAVVIGVVGVVVGVVVGGVVGGIVGGVVGGVVAGVVAGVV